MSVVGLKRGIRLSQIRFRFTFKGATENLQADPQKKLVFLAGSTRLYFSCTVLDLMIILIGSKPDLDRDTNTTHSKNNKMVCSKESLLSDH